MSNFHEYKPLHEYVIFNAEINSIPAWQPSLWVNISKLNPPLNINFVTFENGYLQSSVPPWYNALNSAKLLYDFHSLTFARSRGSCWTPRAQFQRKHTKTWKNVCALYSSALPPFFLRAHAFYNILDSGRDQILFLMVIWRFSTCFAWRPGECINIIH